MNKLLFIICTLLCLSFNAQSQQEDIDQLDINLGIGLLPTIVGTTFGIPVSVSADYPLKKVEHLTVGGYVGYYHSSESFGNGFGSYSYNYNVILFGARATYHIGHFPWMKWMKSDKFDPYFGLMAGFNHVSSSYDGDNTFGNDFSSAGSTAAVSGFVGTKYKFNDRIKLFGEAGYGISVFTFGATFSL